MLDILAPLGGTGGGDVSLSLSLSVSPSGVEIGMGGTLNKYQIQNISIARTVKFH